MAQIRSPFAGQNRFGGRFSQMGQLTTPPHNAKSHSGYEISLRAGKRGKPVAGPDV
jgi:hypothetical protein